MRHGPTRLLICAYGAAGTAGAALWTAGLGVWPAILAFWIGGAALALALPATPGLSALFRRPEDPAADDPAAADPAAWEEDRLADAAARPVADGADRAGAGRA